jgi:hypothetical protein
MGYFLGNMARRCASVRRAQRCSKKKRNILQAALIISIKERRSFKKGVSLFIM